MNRLRDFILRPIVAAVMAGVAALAPHAAAAAEPTCGGASIVDQLHQDAEKYAAYRREADKIVNSGAILWKITGQGGAEPSWLFGTIHISDPRVTDLPPAAAKAIDGARVVALELKEAADPDKITAEMASVAHLMLLPDGENLTGMLDDGSEEAAVEKALAGLGVPLAALDRMRPWVVATMLSIPACEQARAAATGGALDTVIGKRALAANIELVGLETVADQLGAFNAIPLDLQKTYLVDTARVADRIEDVFETMIQLYIARDVAAIMPLMAVIMDKPDYGSELKGFNEAMIETRNRRMAKAAAPLIDDGAAFIAVGALHLPGKDGLVALLRQAGYRVEPVN